LDESKKANYYFVCFGKNDSNVRDYGAECANKACEMNGRKFDGALKPLYVSAAIKKEERK